MLRGIVFNTLPAGSTVPGQKLPVPGYARVGKTFPFSEHPEYPRKRFRDIDSYI